MLSRSMPFFSAADHSNHGMFFVEQSREVKNTSPPQARK
jgi:hypothetical protein